MDRNGALKCFFSEFNHYSTTGIMCHPNLHETVLITVKLYKWVVKGNCYHRVDSGTVGAESIHREEELETSSPQEDEGEAMGTHNQETAVCNQERDLPTPETGPGQF